MHQFQPLCSNLHVQLSGTREIAVRFDQAADKAKLHGIAAGRENDGQCRGRCLGGNCRRGTGRRDNVHFSLDQIGHKRR